MLKRLKKLSRFAGLGKDVEEEHRTTKTFSYKKDGIQLNFSLHVDSTEGLEAFKELLEKALKDVEKELEKLVSLE